MADTAAKSPRLNSQKAKFCQAYYDLGNATAAARAAGYANPNVKGSRLLAKDEDGQIKDAAIRGELARLRGGVVKAVPVSKFTTLDDVERSLKQNLLEMALNKTTSDGPRVAATVALLKAIGADVPREQDGKDDDGARKAIAQMLGVKL